MTELFVTNGFFAQKTAPGGLDGQWIVTHELHINAKAEPEYQPVGVLLTEDVTDEDDLRNYTAYAHTYHTVDFVEGMDSDDPDQPTAHRADLADADIMGSSLVDENGDPTGYHTIALDIDLPVRVRATDTPGHHHLFIDHPLPWDDVVKLLDTLVEIGLVEHGYAEASKARQFTAVRLPWIHKDQLAGPSGVTHAVLEKPDNEDDGR